MYNPQIKIISSEHNWTSIRYVSSNAKSRIATDKLAEKYENGEVTIVNPDKLYRAKAEA